MTNLHKITLIFIFALAALQGAEQTKPHDLSEAEAKDLLQPKGSEDQGDHTFALNGFSLEFDTRRLKHNQILIKAFADPKLNFYGYIKQDIGGHFGSRARIVIDSVLNSNGEEILEAKSTNKKNRQGIGFSESNGKHLAHRKVFLKKDSHHGETIDVKGTIYFSLPTDWRFYTINSLSDLNDVSADPNIDSVDTSFEKSVIFKKSDPSRLIQIVLMSYDANGNRIYATAMSPSSGGISYSWNKDAPEFKNGYVCIAGKRTEIEVPFTVRLSNTDQ